MSQIIFKSVSELDQWIGKEVVVSDWKEIEQERITEFADATEDHQWIHVDAERAKVESPYKKTIAHGYLTMSLLSGFIEESIIFEGCERIINYGLNKVRFITPVVVGSHLRARFSLKEYKTRPDGGVEVIWSAVEEIEGAAKPASVVEMIFLYYF